MDTEALKRDFERKKRGFQLADERRVRELKARTHDEWLHGLKGLFQVREPGVSLFDDAASLQQALVKEGISFCFIGGVALQKWGEVRQTTDVDLTIHSELGREDHLLAALERHLAFRDEKARVEFATSRVFFGRTSNGYDVDIFVGFTPYERRMIERAVDTDYGVDVPLRICSAVDLAVLKTVAGRGQDWVDLKRVIQRSGESLDWDLVYEELEVLLAMAGREENLVRLKKMVDEEYPPSSG